MRRIRPMNNDILVYGANGYTAGLILELAQAEGVWPLLAGRSPDKLQPLAARFGMPLRTFPLDDPARIAEALTGVRVVLNCAGPFHRTARPLAEACIRAGAHYLDITGEIEAFEALARLDAKARDAGVMLMPGAGFDVVPSDCLAAHLKSRLPDATRLVLAIAAIGHPSHGTALTMVENLHRGGAVRRKGRIEAIPAASRFRTIDFGHGPVLTMGIPWGDVSTAWHSTGIGDIEVYMAAPATFRWASRLTRVAPTLFRNRGVQSLLLRQVTGGRAGPTPKERARGRSFIYGEATDDQQRIVAARLQTLEGYTLSALTAWDIAKRVAGEAAVPGFQTPSKVFGADYILGFAETTRVDIS